MLAKRGLLILVAVLVAIGLPSCYAHVCGDVVGGSQAGCPDPQTVVYVDDYVSSEGNVVTIEADVTAKHIQWTPGCTKGNPGCYDNADYGNICNSGATFTSGFSVTCFTKSQVPGGHGDMSKISISSYPFPPKVLSDDETERFYINLTVDPAAPTQHFDVRVAMTGDLSGTARPIYDVTIDWTLSSPECTADANCSGGTPYCETGSGTCVECLNAGHCDDSNVCTTDSCSSNACSNSNAADATNCSSGAGKCCSGTCDSDAVANPGNSGFITECRSGPTCSGANWQYSAANNGVACSGGTCSSGSCHVQGGGGGSCFPAGTRVLMSDGAEKLIEKIIPGDKIRGYDEARNLTITGIVQAIESPLRNHLCRLFFSNGNTLTLTNEHPVYTTQGWKSISPPETLNENPFLSVGKIKVGDKVLDGKDYKEISTLKCWNESVVTYNLILNGSEHTYYANGFLVHNKGGGGSGDGGGDTSPSNSIVTVTDTQLRAGHNKAYGAGDKLRVSLSGETHTVSVESITSTSVKINVSSVLQQAILSIGETKKFSFIPGWYDLSVTLLGISGSGATLKANLTIKSIHESLPGQQTVNSTQNTTTCTEYWNCGEWSICKDGIKSRECEEKNNCGTNLTIPPKMQRCIPSSSLMIYGGSILVILAFIGIVIFLIFKKRGAMAEVSGVSAAISSGFNQGSA